MKLNLKMQHLSRIPPLSVLENEAIRILAFDGEELKVGADTVLFNQGDRAEGAYALLSGSVALERQGELPTPTRLMGAGSLIGVTALIVAGERPTTAMTRENSFLIRLPRHLMLRVLDAYPDSAVAFRQYVADALAEQRNALGRLADAIDAVARRYKSSESITGT